MTPQKPVYSTHDGRVLVRRILSEHGIHPHDYQLEGILLFLDGESLMVTMATGSGKTGFFAFTMLVMIAISRDPSMALEGTSFPKNPAMVIVLPTKALQDDMKANLTKLGLDTVVINGDEEKNNPKLWEECRDHHSMILISPEECINPEFRKLLNNEAFAARACRMGVDEVHLLVSWGSTFRTSYQQLGHIRSRFKYKSPQGGLIPLLAASATIREGQPRTTIANTLGLAPGEYQLLRRTNLRPDIRIIVREMSSSQASASFPDLDWTLACKENTVVFCRTIGFGFRVAAYLWRKGIARGIPDLRSKLRLFNSLNAKEYNEQTLGFLNQNAFASITIATDVLSVGWDSPYTKNVVVFGEPETLDDVLQKFGRAGRNKANVKSPLGILYHTKNAAVSARKMLEGKADPANDKSLSMDSSVADFIVAPCKNECINRLYDNPGFDIPCICPRCKESTPEPGAEVASEPARGGCGRCSGCVPHEPTDPDLTVEKARVRKPTKARAKPGQGISKAMRDLAFVRFLPLRNRVFREAKDNFWSPPELHFPDDLINTLTNSVYSINGEQDVAALVPAQLKLQPFHKSILSLCKELRELFEEIREQERVFRAAKKAAKKPPEPTEAQEELEDSADESEEDNLDGAEGDGNTFLVVEREDEEKGIVECRDICSGRSGIKWTINMKTQQISSSAT